MGKEPRDAPPMRQMRKEPGDLELFRACFDKNTDVPRSPEALEWQYLHNPTGRMFVDIALAPGGGRLAAVYASLPSRVRIDGQVRFALQSLDTLTDTEYRGRGLFVALATRTFSRAAEEGAAFIYGFPNGNSAHGFFKKLAWIPLDPVPFLIRPVRPGYITERLGVAKYARNLVPDVALIWGGARPRSEVRQILFADERITRLWSRFARDVRVAIERDEAYVNWRIFEKPGKQYKVIATETGTELSALCAYTVTPKHGGRIGYILELLHDSGAAANARHLLGLAMRDMADQGADAVLAWCLGHSPNFWAYVRNGFIPLPHRLRPIELHVGVRPFDPAIAGTVCDRSQWYLSYLDSDTV